MSRDGDATPTRRLGPDAALDAELERAAATAGAAETVPDRAIGAWDVVRTIARGGFGAVYEVRRADGARAALKILHAHLVTRSENVARFRREAEVIAELRHPHVVSLIEAGLADDGRPYLCMEYVEGENLDAAIGRRGRFSPSDVLAVIEPVCTALEVAHARGVVHRDVKAANVMLAPGPSRVGRVVLLDFGIAKLVDALAIDLTASRTVVGTPACMAPEQIRGRPVDERTDVYGVGCLAFHLLTGRLPFEEPSTTMAQYLHLHARRPRPSRVAPVTGLVDDVLARAMAIDPAERYATPSALFAALRAALRASARVPTAETGDAAAILVTVRDKTDGTSLDAHLLDDLEAALLGAERVLVDAGWTLAVDLGSSALFVSRTADRQETLALAIELAERLEARPHRDPRVELGVRVHRAPAVFVGTELQPCALAQPATWGVPEHGGGVWASAAAVVDGAVGQPAIKLR